MFDKFFKKESPILGVLGLGGGIARRALLVDWGFLVEQ